MTPHLPIFGRRRTPQTERAEPRLEHAGIGRLRLGTVLLLALFFNAVSLLQAQQSTPLPLIVADFNHDGIPDALVQSTTSPTATIVLGSVPYGSFSPNAKGVTFPAACATPLPQGAVLAGDFNGDGIPDLLFLCGDSAATAGVVLGAGDGTFVAAPVTFQGLSSATAVLGDFNHDGKLDIVLIGLAQPAVGTPPYPAMLFLAGKGDGTFTASSSVAFSGGSTFTSPVAADVNGDGYPDLVVLNVSGNQVPQLNVFGNNQNGTFGVIGDSGAAAPSTVVSLTRGTALSIVSGSFFGSSLPDFVVPVSGTNPVLNILQNTSTASTYSFATPVQVASPGVTGAMAGTFTGSGFTDLVVANGATLSVLTNDGTGSFSSPYSGLSLPFTSALFAVADANGDGYSDLYTATQQTGGALQVAVNLVTGTATARSQPFSLAAGTQTVKAAWPGNVNFLGSTATGTQVVNGVPTRTTLTSNSNPSTVGSSVTLTAVAVPNAETDAIPTGTMILMDGVNMLASGILDGTGTFAYTTSALTQGSHALQALYSGDSFFAASTGTLTQVVNHAPAVAPTITWATPAPIVYGTPLSATQLDAVATDASGAPVPGTFAYTPAAGTILNAGTQTLQVTFTPSDPQSFLTGTASVQLIVQQSTPSTSLTITSGDAAVSTVPAQTVVTLIANVNSATSTLPVGQVSFCDAAAPVCSDIHLLGTVQLANGSALFSFVPGVGAHSYKAVFLGTGNNAASASPAVPLTVTGAKLATTTSIMQSGGVGNYTLTARTVGTGVGTPPTGTISFLNQTSSNAVLATATLGSAASALNFANPSNPAVGKQPVFIVATDLNGDGRLDLVTADGFSQSLTVLLGNGDGTFTAAARPATGNYPDGIAVGDFNQDGIPDLAVTNYYDSTITILLGKGDGTFTAAAGLTTPDDVRQIVTGDFNRDGVLDLAISNDNSVTVFLGNGDGTFTTRGTFNTGNGPNYSLAVADLNGDGKLDLVTTNEADNTLSILTGNGDGTFTASSTPATGTQPTAVTIADFNGDGIPDLAVVNQGAAVLTILLGDGEGGFTAAPSPAVPSGSGQIAAGDFNHDGIVDLAVANSSGNSVAVLTGNGDGTFTQAATPATGNYPVSLAAADLNGDGISDIAAVDLKDQTISVLLTQLTETVTATATGVNPLGPGTYNVVASYPGDSMYAGSVSAATSLTGQQFAPIITWTPAVSTIVFGTALGPQQLNATATGLQGAAIDGVFTYTPAAGAVLGAGQQTLMVTFTPSNDIYTSVTTSVTITVTQATPTLTWATPASIAYGIPLSAAQLDAAVTGVTGAALPGVFTYTPAAGTILTPGAQTLSVNFVPTDAVDYISVKGSVTLQVTGLTLTSISPSMANLGAADTTITLTGSGFVSTSVVQINGTAVTSRLVNPTTLTGVIPAADLTLVGTLQVTVTDPAIDSTSAAQTFTVVAVPPAVTLTGPSSSPSGSQTMLTFTLENPYPVPLTATLTLGFAPSVTPPVDDPMIEFTNGTRTFTFTVPANSTTTPPIMLQAGTVAGTITIPLTLTAGGVNVTPTTLQPLVIVVPAAIPVISTGSLTRNGDQLTVALVGFSNTREMTQATFHFVPVAGTQLVMPDITIPADTLFSTWFSSTPSDAYGSMFTYTQDFTISDGAANIQSIQITLTNSVGASASITVQ
jgi:hypothetical protein